MEKATRYSKKREAILQTICSTDTHPSAEWVYQTLKPEYPDLSLGTVYRNIARFKEEGLVVSVGTVNGQERYDANTHPHTHFVCRKCDAVLDLPEVTADTPGLRKIARHYGLEIDHHELILFGTCSHCTCKH